MATRFLFRSLLTTTKQSLSSALSRSYSSLSTPSSLSAHPLLRLRPLVAVSAHFQFLSPAATSIRGFATRQTSSSLNDPNPNWSNRPPKETILLDGCDFEHWLVVMEPPEGEMTRDEIIDSYVKTLATVVGSEEEARMKLYSVSTKHYFAFGALVSEEVSYKIKELPKVRWVLPDSYLDVRNKDYGGEPVINGVPVPYDPKYHAEWVRNNARANERNRRNDRPRNFDRSRNFERRRENVQQNRTFPNQDGPQSPPNMGPMPPNNMGGPDNRSMPPNNMGGPDNRGMPPNNMRGPPPPPHMGGPPPPPHMGGPPPPPHMGGPPPPPHMGGPPPPPPHMGGPPPILPSHMRGSPPPPPPPPPHMGGPQHNMGNMQYNNMPPNMGRSPQNNMGPYQPNNGVGAPNDSSNYQYRGGPTNDGGPQYQNYDPNTSGGNYQSQDVRGRDMVPPPNYQ